MTRKLSDEELVELVQTFRECMLPRLRTKHPGKIIGYTIRDEPTETGDILFDVEIIAQLSQPGERITVSMSRSQASYDDRPAPNQTGDDQAKPEQAA